LAPTKSKTLTGIAASPGFAVAPALVLDIPEPDIGKRIPPEKVEAELTRMRAAMDKAVTELRQAMHELTELGESEASAMVEFELMVLEDPASMEALEEQVRVQHLAADAAIRAVTAPYTMRYANHESTRFRDRAGEVENAFRTVQNHLLRRELPRLDHLEKPVVIVARDLAPSETVHFDRHRERIAGLVTEGGGRTSHFAILARTFGLPCVVAVPGLRAAVSAGEQLAVDGFSGTVEIRPSKRALDRHRRRLNLMRAHGEELRALRDEPCCTPDGHEVELSANIELPAEVEHVKVSGAQGIGLYRTEFFYLNRPHLPGEQEQFEAYETVAKMMQPKTAIIRTMDLGGDKVASYLGVASEANPFLGWRGIRFALHHPAMLRTQLRAIYRAGVHGNLKMMFPMVTTYAELDQALSLCAEVRNDLKREGITHDPNLEIGMMVETPSAVMSADIMARRVAFFSIGSNDLIQYTLAMDRGNERIAHLYEPLEPAILRSVDHTVNKAHEAGIWVGVCGEMAGDPRIAVLLVGLGVDELSVSPFDVPRVKAAVRSVPMREARRLARETLSLHSATVIRDLLRRELDPQLPGFLLGEPMLGGRRSAVRSGSRGGGR
jgi:phosphotransferase system enzyme I (PtsI)